ncbi:MAG: nicotinate-nucleotide adenylyltransferase [Chromatiales bacterium]
MKPIGILGGSFDPVHNGHLRMAIEVLEALDLDHVRLVPLLQPNGAKAPVAPGMLRLRMLEAAVAGETRLRVDDRELRRGGISYTVDTLESLREEFADQSICLILGMDAFEGLTAWKHWQRLPTLSHLVIVDRPGARMPDSPELNALLAAAGTDEFSHLHADRCGRMLILDISPLDISSTQIRARLARGRSVRYLAPEAVVDFIHRHSMYQSQE